MSTVSSKKKILLYKLKKDYNIDISNEIAELLLGDSKHQSFDVESFCEKIKDNKMKELILQMVNDKILYDVDTARDVIFVYNIVEQLYNKKELKQENNLKKA